MGEAEAEDAVGGELIGRHQRPAHAGALWIVSGHDRSFGAEGAGGVAMCRNPGRLGGSALRQH